MTLTNLLKFVSGQQEQEGHKRTRQRKKENSSQETPPVLKKHHSVRLPFSCLMAERHWLVILVDFFCCSISRFGILLTCCNSCWLHHHHIWWMHLWCSEDKSYWLWGCPDLFFLFSCHSLMSNIQKIFHCDSLKMYSSLPMSLWVGRVLSAAVLVSGS